MANETDEAATSSSTPSSLLPSGYSSISSSSNPIDAPQTLSEIISDAGIYSLTGLCAIAFYKLFPDAWDRPFCDITMSSLIKHLGLPKQVENAMRALMTGEGGDINDFVSLLKEEPMLRSSCIRIIEELVLFAVRDGWIRQGVYDARLRILILFVADLLKVPLPLVELYEESVIEMLTQEIPESSDEEIKEKARRERNKKFKRYFMIGLAGLSGGAIIGLTGGLAAPFIAGGAGAIIGGAAAGALGSTAGIAVIGSLFGVAGAGLTGYKMKKRVGDIEEFAFDVLTQGRELHLTIAISGWVSEEGHKAFQIPWKTLLNTREQYCIRYESSYLLELGRALDYLLSFAVSVAAQEALKYTILSGLIAAIAWPATLLTVASVIDNPWGVCVRRSAEVGKHLADILITRQQGRRPVTLIGFSLGARVIFYCLQEMAQRKGCEGIIEDVVFLGAPVPGYSDQWKPFARVVSGRIINGFCRADWLLKFLYRTSSAQLNIAGLGAIDWSDRRMINVDLSHIVTGHMDYARKMTEVLEAVGVRTTETVHRTEPSYMRKCYSDMPHIMKLTLKPQSSHPITRICKSEMNLRRRYSEPCSPNYYSAKEHTIFDKMRRSSSLESVMSRCSRSSGVIFSPVSTPDILTMRISSSRSFQRSSDLLCLPET